MVGGVWEKLGLSCKLGQSRGKRSLSHREAAEDRIRADGRPRRVVGQLCALLYPGHQVGAAAEEVLHVAALDLEHLIN